MSRLLSEIPHAPNTNTTLRRFQPVMLNADNPLTEYCPWGEWAAAQSAIKADLAYLDRTIVEKHLKGNWILYCSLKLSV
ncbi:hypothetical protein E5676_scaffold434G003450 [Cucumis melo var. makuwa]|uniref:Uncharacterized protein n=2 Tax=Cucumis melo TaxID=3656 RepID=A0A5D3D1J1_CUCMM|nr:hypothetical protein E6C27_scaffold171G003120 [Cucumis melo var. makuwa]TYK17480.1 hypothetical protein E5676_scaffold434G003450 [Cucumis melo var. makuwa]